MATTARPDRLDPYRAPSRGVVSYHRQRVALDVLTARVLADFALTASGHGPWWAGSTFGSWRNVGGGRELVPARGRTVRCRRCVTAGADLTVLGPAGEEPEVRVWGLDGPCRP